ncbi:MULTISPECIES: SusC/RagA family TonB-linked outer membrane protein [unclassified Pedobacter]|uniref:SusC/RagA family TonB-linked outer membrane protein n=1 Tax=unclassified Pedobacter TaxID=2628915 RepID=UPI00141E229B|nr:MULTISPECIES: TonB-dependent receptor [unclassified Pedobacter]NII81172.1 TonB-linked SusC/RagA family outer membrane protein [Pedobacter sp. SG908]NMN35189.1 TonB-linked SusC/RagA family outer membrane protein [Pedobacter sp. SG918]
MRSEVLQFSVTSRWKFFRYLPKVMLLATLIFSAFIAQAQTVVKGKVVDEQGKPLPGVGIVLKGTGTSTSSQDNGNFSITTTGANPVLVFSYVGYNNKEVPVKNQTLLNVALQPSAAELGQVVVVGYGTQRKEAVTGSVASIAGEKIREVPAPNIAQAIQGRLAGVNISQTSTKPGATMQILIRGQRSLSASNDPLVVLDGIPFPGSIGDINPNDIKSIDILKDASATAIYGSRGANGVILLTTNRGQAGVPAKISYNTYTGLQTLFAKYPMMNGPEFTALRKASGLFTTLGVDESNDVNTDWQDLFYNKNAIVTSHDLGVTGGSATSNYSFGGGYYKNQSLIPTQQYTRYSMKASLDQQIGKLFRVGFTTNNNYNISEGNQVGIYGNLSNTPISNPYNADGSLKRTIRMPQDEAFIYTNGIVKNLHDQWLNETRGFATYNSFYGEVKIPGVEGLKYRANLGLDFIQSNNGNFTGVGVGSTTATTVSTAGVSNSQTYHWTLENLITYDRSFGKHSFNAVALYSAEQNKFNSSSMTARDIPSDAFQFYNLGQANGEITIGSGTPQNPLYTLSGLVSYMGRIMYAYDNRFLLSATLRSDASSRLAPGHKWHTYPAVSVGWNMMNESFMKGITAIDKLKIRVGYGQTSNQAVAPYQTLGVLSTRPYNFGDNTYATGYYVSQLPSPGLGWEYSETWNYGLDFSILKNRISGTFEYYDTKTKDILLSVALPSTAGVGSYTANIGQTQNKGWELSLNGVILENQGGWTWDLGFNISANRNKLTALASGQTRDEGNAWFVGHNINAIYDYEKIGLWQAGDPYLNVLEPGGNVGMIKVKYTGDYNASGVPTRAIGAADRQIMDIDPKFTGGFNTRVAYKGFDLNVVGLFKSGGTLVSTLYGSAGYLNLLTGRRNNVKVDYWTPENTDAKYPKPGGIASGDNPKYGSTLGYFDASFLKIRTISLGYDFNRDLIKKSNVKLRMYLTVQNPFVMFSPYHRESGMDPETNSFGDENQAVNSYQRRILTIGTNTPSTRNYVAGLNLTF